MKPAGTVLILSGTAAEWRGVTTALSGQRGLRVLQVRTEAEALATLADVHVDIVFAEDVQGGAPVLEFLGRLQTSHPDIVAVLIAEADATLARRAVTEAGIYEFLRRPLDAQQIALVAQRGIERRELARRQRLLARDFKLSEDWLEFSSRPGPVSLPGETRHFEKLVYVSERMSELCDLAREAARTDQPILIQGETGTGKELLARAIHFHSSRRSGPLVIQNCSAMTETFLQAELFGHEKGAFAGTSSDRTGLLRAADGGTVFLDQICEISRPLQALLLGFMHTGEVKPIGTDRVEASNVRIIVGASQSLAGMVKEGAFRQDLYFRLKGFTLDLPPLRERPEDIPMLAEFFTAKHSAGMGRQILGISASALQKLAAYDFPGNVRELESEIRRMVALAKDGAYLTTRMMSPALLSAVGRKSLRFEGFAPEGATLKEKIESLEKHLVFEALARHRWNRSRVAEELGLSRVGLANKIRRYGLTERPDSAG